MPQEINVNDLIMTHEDGSLRVNHDLVESYGLFNLPLHLMRRTLMVYYENARKISKNDELNVKIFIELVKIIARFPKAIGVNFNRGIAYRRNMRMLRRYSK